GAELGRACDRPDAADGALAQADLHASERRRGQAQAAQVSGGLAPVVEARDRLLAHVAALREAHGALVQPSLLRDRALVDVAPEARAPGFDAHALGRFR